jgi:hypothetical protein
VTASFWHVDCLPISITNQRGARCATLCCNRESLAAAPCRWLARRPCRHSSTRPEPLSHRPERAKLYGRFQKMLLDDSPGSVIYVQNFACGFSNKVHDVVVSPLMVLDFSKAALTA